VRFKSHDEQFERADEGDVDHHWLGHTHESERDCRTLVLIELGIHIETYQDVDGTVSRCQIVPRLYLYLGMTPSSRRSRT
jgi:hypothetical protein